MTFFFREMRELIEKHHLYLAVPPLYRVSQAGRRFTPGRRRPRPLIAEHFRGRGRSR